MSKDSGITIPNFVYLYSCPLCGSLAGIKILANGQFYPVCRGMVPPRNCMLARTPDVVNDGYTRFADAVAVWNRRPANPVASLDWVTVDQK